MKKLFAFAVLGLAVCLQVLAQSQPIATINESWALGGHPPSQSPCTSQHFNCAVQFGTDGTMYDYEYLNGGPRINWRPGQSAGYRFTGITGLQTTEGHNPDGTWDGTITETYTFENLPTLNNNVAVGYASGTYTLTVYLNRNVWNVKSAQLSAEVFAQAQESGQFHITSYKG